MFYANSSKIRGGKTTLRFHPLIVFIGSLRGNNTRMKGRVPPHRDAAKRQGGGAEDEHQGQGVGLHARACACR